MNRFELTKEVSRNGVQVDEVLEVVRDFLMLINVGDLRNRETSLAITKIEEALHWLNARTQDRIDREVEGTSIP